MPPAKAHAVSFTVVSVSISLIAVCILILLVGGFIGGLLREFAVTLSAAILVSLVVSFTTPPIMRARLLRAKKHEAPLASKSAKSKNMLAGFDATFSHGTEQFFAWMLRGYERSLSWVLRHPVLIAASLFPKAFRFPLRCRRCATRWQKSACLAPSRPALRLLRAAFSRLLTASHG